MKRGLKLLCLSILVAASRWGGPAHGQMLTQGPIIPSLSHAFDPAAAITTLTSASAGQSGPAGPFSGLATPIAVDPLLGTATASIPIELPPGRKGVTPDLTVRYSSNGGNGILGVGWDMVIGRIERNTAHGVPLDYTQSQPGNPVYSDTNGFVLVFRGGTIVLDRCKDGSSPCTSWGASSEETWLDAQFSANNWRITGKDGTTYTYGGMAPALTGPNTASPAGTFGWYLTHVEDPNGNAMDITYAPGNGDSYAYPAEIDYGANPTAGFASHVFHVAIGYNDPNLNPRPDIITTYRSGFAQRISQRVLTITVWVDGWTTQTNFTRQYQFSYTQDLGTGWSLLQSVAEAVAAGTAPPRVTTFTYESGSYPAGTPGFSTQTSNLNFDSAPASGGGISFLGMNGVVSGFLDIDGDGLPDFLNGIGYCHGNGSPCDAGMELYHNRGGSFAKEPGSNGDGVWTSLPNDGGVGLYWLAGPATRMIDMDGDGIADIVNLPDSCQSTGGCACSQSGLGACTWRFFRGTGTSFVDAGDWTGVPDDVFGIPLSTVVLPTMAYPNYLAQLIDLDGDGRPDLLDCTGLDPALTPSVSCRFYRNIGHGFAPSVPWTVPQTSDASLSHNPLAAVQGKNSIKELIDINGDGLPDLVSSRVSGNGYWDVWLNDGNGFEHYVQWPAPPVSPAYLQMDEDTTIEGGWYATGTFRGLRDMNGDGLPDYVDARTSPWTVYLNTGAGFVATDVPWGGTQGLSYIAVNMGGSIWHDVLDVNGDGISDYVFFDSGVMYAHFGMRARGSLLVTEQNGLGASYAVTYVPSTDPATAGTGCNDGTPCLSATDCPSGTCAWPCTNCSRLPFPTWVVQSLSTHTGFPGPGNDFTSTYTFTGGYFDPVGRQFRGFRQSVETRTADGRMVRRQFAPPP